MKKFGPAKISAVLLALASALFGSWYYLSPYWALKGLQNALEEGNAAQLAAHIDFKAVRNNLKPQIKARLDVELIKDLPADNAPQAEGELPPALQRELVQAGAAMAMPMINAMLDALLTPQGLAKFIENNQDVQTGAPLKTTPPKTTMELMQEAIIEREGFSGFTVRTGKTDKALALIFLRDGLGWKLTDIKLPVR
jgi:hypothetical protein